MTHEGKTAIVTGAAQGIGEAYAHGLARVGASVIVSDINAEKGAAVAAAICKEGGTAGFIQTDVSDPESAENLAREARALYGPIDYLVNNAAIFAGKRKEGLLTIEWDYYRHFMTVNVDGALIVSRAVVQRAVYDEVVDKIVAGVNSLKIGDPFDPETQVGPFCTAQQLEKVEHFVKVGKDSGARLVAGGKKPDLGQGWFFEPTVFADVDPNMEIAQEEIFGPVLSIIPFEDEAEAIAIANNSIYGLGSGV